MSQRCESFASEMICRLVDKHMTQRFGSRANHAPGKTLGGILSSSPAGVAFTLTFLALAHFAGVAHLQAKDTVSANLKCK
jgi:hypothetical protein